jgi:hypothetical protein
MFAKVGLSGDTWSKKLVDRQFYRVRRTFIGIPQAMSGRAADDLLPLWQFKITLDVLLLYLFCELPEVICN